MTRWHTCTDAFSIVLNHQEHLRTPCKTNPRPVKAKDVKDSPRRFPRIVETIRCLRINACTGLEAALYEIPAPAIAQCLITGNPRGSEISTGRPCSSRRVSRIAPRVDTRAFVPPDRTPIVHFSRALRVLVVPPFDFFQPPLHLAHPLTLGSPSHFWLVPATVVSSISRGRPTTDTGPTARRPRNAKYKAGRPCLYHGVRHFATRASSSATEHPSWNTSAVGRIKRIFVF